MKSSRKPATATGASLHCSGERWGWLQKPSVGSCVSSKRSTELRPIPPQNGPILLWMPVTATNHTSTASFASLPVSRRKNTEGSLHFPRITCPYPAKGLSSNRQAWRRAKFPPENGQRCPIGKNGRDTRKYPSFAKEGNTRFRNRRPQQRHATKRLHSSVCPRAAVVAHTAPSSTDHPSCAVGAASPPVSGTSVQISFLTQREKEGKRS